MHLFAACVALLVPHQPLNVPHAHVSPRTGTVALSAPAAAEVEFPAPLSPPQKLRRAASFWVRVLPVIGSYLRLYSEFQMRERLLGECLDEEACEVAWEDEHNRGAVVLSSAINDLKGFYVKTGQIIASRQDLFPRQYTEALSGLTDMLDPMPVELGAPLGLAKSSRPADPLERAMLTRPGRAVAQYVRS